MKKLGLFLAVMVMLVPSAPIMAADWNFYGSARMATWYQTGDAAAFDNPHDNGNLNESDQELTWDLQSNARIGAKVKHENVSGYFEYGSGPNLRKLYATWKPGNWQLLIGQTYTPISDVFYSNQVYFNDEELLSTGQVYDSRKPQIAIKYGDFRLAFVKNTGASSLGITYADGAGGTVAGDVDVTLPKFEARFHHAWDMVFVDILGGYQTYNVENPSGGGRDFDIDSYVFGGGAGVNIGPAVIKGFAWYGQNSKQFGLYLQSRENIGGNAVEGAQLRLDANGNIIDVEDTNTLGLLGVIGYKINDMISVEGGYGYIRHENDLYDEISGHDSKMSAWYVNAAITLAKGVFIVPEVGMYDFHDSAVTPNLDLKDFTYFGAKWQINF